MSCSLIHLLVIVETVVVALIAVVIARAFAVERLAGKNERKSADHAEEHGDSKEKADHLEDEPEDGRFFDLDDVVVKPVGSRVVSEFGIEYQEDEERHAEGDHAEFQRHFRRGLRLLRPAHSLDLHHHEARAHVLHFPDKIHQENEPREQDIELDGVCARRTEQDRNVGDEEILDQL